MSLQTWLEPPEATEYEIEHVITELIRDDDDNTLPATITSFAQLLSVHIYTRFTTIADAFVNAYIARLNTCNSDIDFYVTEGISAVLITCSEHDQDTLEIEAIEIMADRELALAAFVDVILS